MFFFVFRFWVFLSTSDSRPIYLSICAYICTYLQLYNSFIVTRRSLRLFTLILNKMYIIFFIIGPLSQRSLFILYIYIYVCESLYICKKKSHQLTQNERTKPQTHAIERMPHAFLGAQQWNNNTRQRLLKKCCLILILLLISSAIRSRLFCCCLDEFDSNTDTGNGSQQSSHLSYGAQHFALSLSLSLAHSLTHSHHRSHTLSHCPPLGTAAAYTGLLCFTLVFVVLVGVFAKCSCRFSIKAPSYWRTFKSYFTTIFIHLLRKPFFLKVNYWKVLIIYFLLFYL